MSVDESGLRTARRESTAAEIAHQLIGYLLGASSEAKAGDRLPPERRLAEIFGVGRSAVREALKSLSLLGLVEIRQGDGTYLRSPDSELLPRVIEWGLFLGERSVSDLTEARQHIETVLAGLAAERRSEEDLELLRQLVSRMEDMEDNPDAFVEADLSFHLTLASASGNSILSGILVNIESLLRVWIRLTIEAGGKTAAHRAAADHRAVLTAVENGDPKAAAAAMAVHMEDVAARLQHVVEHSSKRPREDIGM